MRDEGDEMKEGVARPNWVVWEGKQASQTKDTAVKESKSTGYTESACADSGAHEGSGTGSRPKQSKKSV